MTTANERPIPHFKQDSAQVLGSPQNRGAAFSTPRRHQGSRLQRFDSRRGQSCSWSPQEHHPYGRTTRCRQDQTVRLQLRTIPFRPFRVAPTACSHTVTHVSEIHLVHTRAASHVVEGHFSCLAIRPAARVL